MSQLDPDDRDPYEAVWDLKSLCIQWDCRLYLFTENSCGHSSQKPVLSVRCPEVLGPRLVLRVMQSVKVVGCKSSGNQQHDHRALASVSIRSPQRQ